MAKNLKGKELPKGIYQRKDGRYEARAQVKGITIQLYNRNLRELLKEFEQAKQEAQNGIDKRYEDVILNDWFEEWFNTYKVPRIKPHSITPMKTKFRAYFGKAIGTMKVKDIRSIDIQNVINDMKEKGRATSTMREALGTTRECLECAKHNRIISDNPCFAVTVPWENTSKERRFLTREEQKRFLDEVEYNWYKEMFHIMFYTGMRIGEVGGLKWEDIDFKNKCININRSLHCQYDAGVKTTELTTPKTANSYRTIPFMGDVERMLLDQKKKQKELKKNLGKRYRSEGEFADLVFMTSMGGPIIRNVAEKECNKVVKSINDQEAYLSVKENREPVYMERIYPHAIRHTFCTRCFEVGMDPKIVQKLMGHQHYSTTIDIYTHVIQEDVHKEAQKMTEVMEEIEQMPLENEKLA